MSDATTKEIVKHCALSLASIASRHFFEGEPDMAIKACQLLVELGPIVHESTLTAEELAMPWTRLIHGARQCQVADIFGPSSLSKQAQQPPNSHIITMEQDLDESPTIYAVMDVMSAFRTSRSDSILELL